MGEIADAMIDEMFLNECEWCGSIYPDEHDRDCLHFEEKET